MRNAVIYDVISGPSKDRIFDAFKYYRGGKINLYFGLSESDLQPPGGYCFKISNLGTNYAVAEENFTILSIKYITPPDDWTKHGLVLRIKGDCDLFYLDKEGNNGFHNNPHGDPCAYHVDFHMTYDTELRRGQMTCYNYRVSQYGPYD